jgi:hypothetical protein
VSVQLDEMFDESPGVVCVVLSHAIEAEGWRLVHVSESGDRLIWQVVDASCAPAMLQATIEPCGDGAHVRVTSYGAQVPELAGLGRFAPPPATGPAPSAEGWEPSADVLDFRRGAARHGRDLGLGSD